MSATLTTLFWGLLAKLLTEGFVYKVMIRGLWWASQKTTNEMDDGMVEDAAKALNVTDYK